MNFFRENPANIRRKLLLVFYDILIILLVALLILGVNPSSEQRMPLKWFAVHILLFASCIFVCRHIAAVYRQVWRYGGSLAYIRLILADIGAGALYYILQVVLPVARIEFIRIVSLAAITLLFSLSLRLMYYFLYERANRSVSCSGLFWKVVEFISGFSIMARRGSTKPVEAGVKIKVAIVGAGRVGAMLADELLNNPRSHYVPCFFIDIDEAKIGREIMGLPVYSDEEATIRKLVSYPIQEIVFALPQITPERKKELYSHYKQTGCKIKVYDYPVMQKAESGRRQMREFDIEELLFRKPIDIRDSAANDYYRGKVILITGGGGSIGSELCRQISKMQPKSLIILDVYENGAYDVQQELRFLYGSELDLHVEIVSVCDRRGFEKVMETYRPDILLHAAAHKHVPLMEHNCCEAVKNNVFGTLNAVELSEKYGVGRFIMVSTDKAVNPTNVMGATKRMCEMIVLSRCGENTGTVFSATRFGNVLGSAGSVIPLFRRQIMNGGPLTITDKRIIRYFMTIPEASQLVLQSGVMAKNGELFVLDMGEPVRILELAENMIRLSGYEPYEDIQIVETGLRPGEKLYEELLIRTEELDKTENSMIFIERDAPLSADEIAEKLKILSEAVETEDDRAVKAALRRVVPTFYSPEELNSAISRTELPKAEPAPAAVQ
ncbi:MAG: polysaccharide biosynthesis protein [Clostridia bacterium]|nr:polysaccharide biosynthesis protein [Clostridia bacterium]